MGCGASTPVSPSVFDVGAGTLSTSEGEVPGARRADNAMGLASAPVVKLASNALGATRAASEAVGQTLETAVYASTDSRAEMASAAAATASEAVLHAADAASAAGHALLELGKTLPWVAPVAFLIASVVKAARNAQTLRADAEAFCRTVASVEDILTEAGENGTLAKARTAVEDLRSALQEGLAFCQRLQSQSTFAAMLLSSRDATKLFEINGAVMDAVNVITLMASVTTAQIVTANFEQSKRLKSKLDEFGGASAAVDNPELLEQLEHELEASDKLLMASVEAVRIETKKSHRDLIARLKTQSEEAQAQSDVMSKQIDKLTTMMSVLMKLRAGGDDASPQALAEQTTGDVVEEVMQMMPIPDNEVERIEQMRDLGMDADVTTGNDISDLVEHDDLKALIDDAKREFGVAGTFIGALNGDELTMLVHKCETRSGDVAILSGMSIPREFSACQHVIARDDVVHVNGIDGVSYDVANGKQLPFISMNDLGSLAETGLPSFTKFAHRMGKMAPDKPEEVWIEQHGRQIKNKEMRGLTEIFQEKNMHYTGVPIRVNGKAVATFCMLDRKHRDDMTNAEMKAKVLSFADRAAAILAKRAENGKAAARTGGKGHANGSLDGAIESAAEEPATANNCALQLTKDTFVGEVLNHDRDVVVLLVAPWCANCSAMHTAWDAAARGRSKPRFAMFDVDTDDPPVDHPAWKVSAVPAVVLAPRGRHAEPVRYDGAISAASIGELERWLADVHGVVFDPPLDTRNTSAPALASSSVSASALAIQPAAPILASPLELVAEAPSNAVALAPSLDSSALALSGTPGLTSALAELVHANASEVDMVTRMLQGTGCATPALLDSIGRILSAQHTRAESLVDELGSAHMPASLRAWAQMARMQVDFIRFAASARLGASPDDLAVLAEAVAARHGDVHARLVRSASIQAEKRRGKHKAETTETKTQLATWQITDGGGKRGKHASRAWRDLQSP